LSGSGRFTRAASVDLAVVFPVAKLLLGDHAT